MLMMFIVRKFLSSTIFTALNIIWSKIENEIQYEVFYCIVLRLTMNDECDSLSVMWMTM